jgi:hypothetical protein
MDDAPEKGPPLELDRLDPETGIQVLSRVPPDETLEQARKRLFWRFQSEQQRDWRAGDVLAPARALFACKALSKPPPHWLVEAFLAMIERRLSDAERRQYGDFTRHRLRWQAVKQCRDRGTSWDDSWLAAADMLAGTDASGSDETVRSSYKLIQNAGGEKATLVSYRRAIARAGAQPG